MSLSDLASLGSFVSGAAVLASLVFLFFQMRQMTEQVRQTEKNQQGLIRQARSTRTVDITLSAFEACASEAYAEASSRAMRGEEDIPRNGLLQLSMYWRAAFYNYEDAFYQHLDGLLTESAFNTFKTNVRNVAGEIQVRAIWRIHRLTFGVEFVAWMDKLIAETPIREPLGTDVRWRDALRAEKSGAPY